MRYAIPLMAAAAAGVVVLAGLATTFERPPVISIQNGFRGTGMQEVYNPRIVRDEAAANKAPAASPQVHGGPKAGVVYKNVQVLKDLDVAAFTRLMAAITTWVAPKQGCNYCHVAGNMADDTLYTKVVSRRMIQMVQRVNGEWTSHVGATGVTCYTCHRGQPVPAYVWTQPNPPHPHGSAEVYTGKNLASPVANNSSLPYDPITPFLDAHPENIRVQATVPLPGTDPSSIKQTEWTYALMAHFSQSLGVGCDYCHNTRAFGQWSQSPPARATAWYGIRMVRDLNVNFLDPLASVLPANRHGPLGDGPKVDCMTCHQGVYKPLFGAAMAKDFPELGLAVKASAP